GSNNRGVSKTAFLTVLIIAIGLAAFSAYKLFFNQTSLNDRQSTSMQFSNDSLYNADTSLKTAEKSPRKKNEFSDSVKKINTTAALPNTDEFREVSDTLNTSAQIISREEPAPAGEPATGTKYRVLTIAHFHDKPDEGTRRNAFITYQDKIPLTALDEQNDFIYVIFTNSQGQTSKGWIRKKDLTVVNE
ncbi:MAG TPA: hypothetical protein VK498_12135, partial [Ferruginibacter sp.]|nr:hypothetical protein [Ferruginibacter sp.]